MNSMASTFSTFSFLLSWGDQDCILHPKIYYEQIPLMVSEELPSIPFHWHHLPHSQSCTHLWAQGAKYPLQQFALFCIGSTVEWELDGIKDVLCCPPEDLSTEELTMIYIEDFILKFSTPGFGGILKLWALLASLMQTPEQCLSNIKKLPNLVHTDIGLNVLSSLLNWYMSRSCYLSYLRSYLVSQFLWVVCCWTQSSVDHQQILLSHSLYHICLNKTLICHGSIGSSPLFPSVTILIWTLAAFCQQHHVCLCFSIQAQAKSLCHLHQVSHYTIPLL